MAGSSQAKALTCTISSGGKRPGATRSGAFFQPGQSLFEKALAPLADDFPAGVQAAGDLVIRPTFGRMENHLGAEHLKIWRRISGCSALQLLPFDCREFDFIRALSRHISTVPQWTELAIIIRYCIYEKKHLAEAGQTVGLEKTASSPPGEERETLRVPAARSAARLWRKCTSDRRLRAWWRTYLHAAEWGRQRLLEVMSRPACCSSSGTGPIAN